VGSTSKTPPRLNENEHEDHKCKGLCFSCDQHGHQSFQCPKRLHKAVALSLIVPKEGRKTKNHGAKDKRPI